MKLKSIFVTSFLVLSFNICFIFSGCNSSTAKSLINLRKASESVYSNAQEITKTQAPLYTGQTESEKENFISLISNNSAELIVKLGEIESVLENLSNTNKQLNNEINALKELKKEVNSDDDKNIKKANKNLKTINNNINSKCVDVKQQIATINAEIVSVSSNSQNITESQNNVNECYSRIFNALDYIKTEVSEVNTLVSSILQVVNNYLNNSEQQSL